MRYKELLVEKITNRPHRVGVYLKNRLKDVQALSARMVTAGAEIIKHRNGERLLYDLLRYGSDYNDACGDLYRLVYSLSESPSHVDAAKNVAEDLKSVITYGTDPAHGRSFWGYLINALQRYKPLGDEEKAVISILNTVPLGAKEYGFKQDDEDEDYREAMGLYDALAEGVRARIHFDAVVVDLRGKLGEVYKIMHAYTDKYRPEHDEVEKLYHATAFCTEILRDGFAAEKPDGRRGLGSYGSQPEISFTHSLEIAHTLARCLKEVWMIAHGKLTARQIVGWIEKEGMDVDSVERAVGLSVKTGEEHPLFGQRTRLKKLSELNGVSETAKLYKVYLAFSEIRTDPLFTYIDETAEMMKTRHLSDIGVLECEVRLTPEDQYFVGESEFRVTADRVKSVRKVF